MSTILVVDDEPQIVQLVRDYLARSGDEVIVAGDGPAAIVAIAQRRPDLVILDLGLPGLDGLDVTRRIRATSSIPIVMLTARSDETDTLVGLELGAAHSGTIKAQSPDPATGRGTAITVRVLAGAAESGGTVQPSA